MLTLPPAVRIHLAVQPIDIRKSLNGLSSAVREVLLEVPFLAIFSCFGIGGPTC